MASTPKPDFILNCYAPKNNSDINKDDLYDIIFLSIKNSESIDGGLLRGGSEKLKVVALDSSEYEGTISPCEFNISRFIPFSNGGGYKVVIKGNLRRHSGEGNFYVGSYRVYDSSKNQEVPFFAREFRMSASDYFKRHVA
jgi:hypothetical protein